MAASYAIIDVTLRHGGLLRTWLGDLCNLIALEECGGMNGAGSAREAALKYAERGWSVFPLLPGTKRPAVLWADYQRTRADTEQIEDWWKQWPDAGVAIVTGTIS